MNKALQNLQNKFIEKAKYNRFVSEVESSTKLISYFDNMIYDFVNPIIAIDESLFYSTDLQNGKRYNLYGNVLTVSRSDVEVVFSKETPEKVSILLRVVIEGGMPKVVLINRNAMPLEKSHLESVIENAFKI